MPDMKSRGGRRKPLGPSRLRCPICKRWGAVNPQLNVRRIDACVVCIREGKLVDDQETRMAAGGW